MINRLIVSIILFAFSITSINFPTAVQASTLLGLPAAGTMVSPSPSFEPALIKGLTVHQDNPFLFDFIVDPGQFKVSTKVLKDQADRMIKYFFAALTIPDKDIWVNLSPYERDRMIPASLGQTAMGRDLLAQDYMLKQLTASLIYPQKALGKMFWNKVYSKAKEMYGTTQIPVNTFNKVWVVPQKAGIYEHGQTAFIVEGHLKVMLEEDYLAMSKHQRQPSTSTIGSQIIRQIILPQIEKEINEGKNFATLRQIFYAQVLAVWFKRNIKQALLNQVYANKSTVKGIEQNDSKTNEAIYRQYLKAYKKGVFNFIQEDSFPPLDGEGRGGVMVPRKYFSGGFGSVRDLALITEPLSDKAMAAIPKDFVFSVVTKFNAAMTSAKMNLSDLGDVYGKIVVVREGYDVALDKEGNLVNPNDPRIMESLPTIEYLTSNGAKVVLIAHLGRPNEEIQKLLLKNPGMSKAEARNIVFMQMSLDPVSARLRELLGKKFKPFNSSSQTMPIDIADEIKPGEVTLLRNLRFYKGEEDNDPGFAEALFNGVYAYVNDAPSANQRGHASIVGAPAEIPRVMGYLTEKEMKILEEVHAKAKMAIIGGLKVKDKIGMIRQFLKADPQRRVLIGGAMANAFLQAQGIDIQRSLGADSENVGIAKTLLKEFNQGPDNRIEIPMDVVAVNNFNRHIKSRNIDFSKAEKVPKDWVIVDIGPITTAVYIKWIKETTFWNGPMGAYDRLPKYASYGTRNIARAIAWTNGFVGGGDSLAAWYNDSILPPGLRADSKAQILTGGGATLDYLEGKPLPGIEALSDASAAMTAVHTTHGLDAAMRTNADVKGGIDLSRQDAALRVEKDADGGVKVNVDPALIARIEHEGLSEIVPVIINIRPADIRTLFGTSSPQ